MKTFLILVLGCLLVAVSNTASSANRCVSRTSAITVTAPGPVAASVGSEALAPGSPLSEWFTLETIAYDCEPTPGSTPFYVVRSTPTVSPVPGVSAFDGTIVHAVYPTGIPGVGVAMGYARSSLGYHNPVGDPNGYINFGNAYDNLAVSVSVKAQWVVTGTLPPSSFTVGQMQVATLNLSNGGNPAPIRLYLGSTDVHVTARTCVPVESNQSVELRNADVGDFRFLGDRMKAADVGIPLSCSGSSTPFHAFATFTDVQNPSNTGTDITLKPGSAPGIGLQLWKDGSALRMGPDNLSSNNPGRWYVGKINGMVNIPLEVYYVQTGATVDTGPVNASVTFTLSYP